MIINKEDRLIIKKWHNTKNLLCDCGVAHTIILNKQDNIFAICCAYCLNEFEAITKAIALGLKVLGFKIISVNINFNKQTYKSYKEYLQSCEWKEKREIVLIRDKYLCQSCMLAKATIVHHKNYDNIFNEPLFDLISVCDKCHKRIHSK
jgi:hypothetical protein